jgi:molecular chaperone DnaJ
MDLYQVLSVPRNATSDEIERAYRRLARRFHPGVNPGDARAEQVYRQIQTAYQVLGDLEQRREYDRAGHAYVPAAQVETTIAFEGFDFAAAAEGPRAATFAELFADVFQDAARRATAPDRGLEIEATLQLSFEDAMRGGHFPLSIVRHDRCSSCGGDGRTGRAPQTCPHCGGAGTRRWARGHMVFTKACDVCDGTGQLTSQICRTCAGVGVAPRSEVVTVSLPPGIESGARVVVPGRGHAAKGGAAGDLYVVVDVAPHPFLRRDGRDLLLTLPVAIHEAALGARVDVPTLDAPLRLRLPPGTQSGQRLRIPGRGVPAASGDQTAAGDLIVEIQLVLPPLTDERSKALLKEFGRLHAEDVRRHLFDQRSGA